MSCGLVVSEGDNWIIFWDRTFLVFTAGLEGLSLSESPIMYAGSGQIRGPYDHFLVKGTAVGDAVVVSLCRMRWSWAEWKQGMKLRLTVRGGRGPWCRMKTIGTSSLKSNNDLQCLGLGLGIWGAWYWDHQPGSGRWPEMDQK